MHQPSGTVNEPMRPGHPDWYKSGAVMVFRGALVLFGMGVVGLAVWIGGVASDTRRWPTAEGVVIAAEIVRHTGGRRGVPHTEARIQYQYTVDGQSHRNDVLGFHSGSSRFGVSVQSIVAGYAVGTPVTVYHDPDNPRQSVLEPGTGGVFSPIALLALLGVLFIILGIALGPYLKMKARARARAIPGGVPL